MGSPAEGGGPSKPAGTQRKCANCGQVGHIKTNKKCVAPPSYLPCLLIRPVSFCSLAPTILPSVLKIKLTSINRLCPMLNGTMKPEDRMGDSAFAMGAPPAV